MRKSFIAIALGAWLTMPAFAADLPARAPAIAPAPTFVLYNWSGFYVGANVGYAFSDSNNVQTVGTPGFLTLVPGIVPGSLSSKRDGFIGGIQAGYNVQSGAFVYGIEADIQFSDAKKTASFIGAPVLGTPLNTSASSSLDYLGTARLRAGYAFDRFLVYVTGGLAFGGTKLSNGVVGVAAPGLVWSGSSSGVKIGWTIGAGAEYAITNNLSIKGEYLYYDLASRTSLALGNAAVRGIPALNGIDYSATTKFRGSVARIGINYKFGGSAAPVVASY